jgi:UDP-N-acetylmuramate dehydrogenase
VSDLRHRLPAVRGRLEADAPLAAQTWFWVGGKAEVLFRPADEEDLAHFLAHTPLDIPLTLISIASNLLIRDGGLDGVVIRLGAPFSTIKTDDTHITAGSAALDMNVAKAAAAANIGGLEFMSGIPGSIGGGLRMNAGAYGGEFKDVLIHCTALDRQGQRHTLTAADCDFTYRHSAVPSDWVFLKAMFQGHTADNAAILTRMQDIQTKRGSTQPIKEKTGGSTFANPDAADVAHLAPNRHKAWQLIDGAGCRGLRVGGAMMSEQHCNFMINTGTATAADLEALGEEVRRRVLENYGVTLRWEIVRIGKA